MTPDRYDYHPCPTCGVLAPVDRPHPATFCARERPADDWLKEVTSGPPSPPLPEGLFHVGLSVDPALWGGK